MSYWQPMKLEDVQAAGVGVYVLVYTCCLTTARSYGKKSLLLKSHAGV
jgi:hypothetical protein